MNATEERIRLYAKELRMPSFARFEEIAREALTNRWGYAEFLVELLEAELEQRRENQMHRRIKAAQFPQVKTLDSFDFCHAKHLDRAQIYELATGRFIEEKRPIIAFGNPGTGKTHLALAIAYQVCCAGYKTLYTTAAQLLTDLAEASEQRRLSRLHQKLLKLDLLVIDELSYLTFGRPSAELLFQVISSRHELRSVLITTNLPFSRWTELFGDEMLTVALVDRLAHRAIILDTNGESYRLISRRAKFGGEIGQ